MSEVNEVGRKNVFVPSGMLETIIPVLRTRIELVIFDDRFEGSKMTDSMLSRAFCHDTPIVEGITVRSKSCFFVWKSLIRLS